MNVLLVEDDADIGSMLSRGLKVEGFDVTTVERADQALDTARDINPCAVVLDMMAGLTGQAKIQNGDAHAYATPYSA